MYLMWVSNVEHQYDNNVMKDVFGGNKQHLNIFVTWMVVLDQNSGKDFWDTEEVFPIPHNEGPVKRCDEGRQKRCPSRVKTHLPLPWKCKGCRNCMAI
jgi:hypothetical protein